MEEEEEEEEAEEEPLPCVRIQMACCFLEDTYKISKSSLCSAFIQEI